jgi:protein Mpv17
MCLLSTQWLMRLAHGLSWPQAMQNGMSLRGNPFKRAWAAYERQLERHPVPTQVATSCLLWGVGDLLAQRLEHYERQQAHKKAVAATVAVPGVAPGSSVLQAASGSAAALAAAAEPTMEVDWRRAVLTGIFGATFVGPVGHFWYLNLDKWCMARFKPGSATFIATKVVLDTVTMGPFYVASFFGFGTAFMDGGGWQEFARKMRTDFWPTLIAEVTFWPFVQTLNFSKVRRSLGQDGRGQDGVCQPWGLRLGGP